jgi:hypothetical protein
LLLIGLVFAALPVASALAGDIEGANRSASAAALHGYECAGTVRLFAGHTKLTLTHESKWDTDSWHQRLPAEIPPAGKIEPAVGRWESRGGFFRGCHNDIRYHTEGHGTLEFTITKPFNGIESWDCRNLDPGKPGCYSITRRTSDKFLSVTFNVDLP